MSFGYNVFKVVRTIPKGTIMTYKEVATLSGNARAYRAVGNILHRNPDLKNIPCHRVVRSDMTLSTGYVNGGKANQKRILLSEGVKFDGEKIIRSK